MRLGRVLRLLGQGLLGLVVLVVVLIGGVIGYDVLFSGRNAARFANAEWAAADGATVRGYIARPDGAGPHPAILLLHEWWGLNEDIVAKAELLADQGYLVVAPDLYRGASTRSIPRAILLVSTTPQPRIAADVDSALEYLRQLDSVDPQRIAVWGFCFGGDQSLQAGTRHADLAATIIFYGDVITEDTQLGALPQGGPVLGVFGAEDQQIPVAEVERFEQLLARANIPHEVTIYPGVGHAFVPNVESLQPPGPPQQAWEQTLRFLETNVKGG